MQAVISIVKLVLIYLLNIFRLSHLTSNGEVQILQDRYRIK